MNTIIIFQNKATPKALTGYIGNIYDGLLNIMIMLNI